MNLSIPFFAVLIGVVLAAALLRPEWLLALWVTALFAFPLARCVIAGAPIYCYDLIMLVLITAFFFRRIHRLWPATVPRWHWWMIGTAFALSVVAGFVRNGFSLSLVYVWGHSTLAWLAFPLGVLATSFPQSGSLKHSIRLGLVVSACVLTPVALIQYLDLPQASALMQFLYGDIGVEEGVDRLRVGLLSNRAPGPHFAPTTFGGIALLALAVFWLVSDRSHRAQRWIMLGCSGTIILCTVSRHVIVAALLGVCVVFALGELRARLRIVATIGIAAVALILIGPGLGLTQSWENRTLRLEDGVMRDENIAGRVLDGPLRLARFIEKNPSTLVTGAGLEVEKTTGRSNQTDIESTGFVSNSFLLPLYYLGIPGLIIYLLFWIWAARSALKLPHPHRAIPCGIVVTAIVLILSDNYAFIYEPAVALLFMIPGLIAGRNHARSVQQLDDSRPVTATTLLAGAEPIATMTSFGALGRER